MAGRTYLISPNSAPSPEPDTQETPNKRMMIVVTSASTSTPDKSYRGLSFWLLLPKTHSWGNVVKPEWCFCCGDPRGAAASEAGRRPPGCSAAVREVAPGAVTAGTATFLAHTGLPCPRHAGACLPGSAGREEDAETESVGGSLAEIAQLGER